MDKQISFSNLEKDFSPKLRNKISTAEDKVDVGNHFSYIAMNLLKQAYSGRNLEFYPDDVVFNKQNNNYELSGRLRNSKEFRDLWDKSDIPHIFNRFANTASDRCIHLSKGKGKTEKKIRN